jgi:hypothetical protein
VPSLVVGEAVEAEEDHVLLGIASFAVYYGISPKVKLERARLDPFDTKYLFAYKTAILFL